jgi:hypothetical protein
VPGKPSAEPPLRAEEQDVDQARDDGRHRERQVDQRDERGLAGKVELCHRPGRREPEHQVERHGDGGGQKREADGRPRIGLDNCAEVRAEPLPKRLDEDGHHGQADEQDQKGEGDGDQNPPDHARLARGPHVERPGPHDLAHGIMPPDAAGSTTGAS